MIKVFKTTDDLTASDLQSNGDVVLQPSKAVVSKSENGEFFLELEVPLKNRSALGYGYQIVADYLGDYEIFRVGAVTYSNGKSKVKCPHITYDTDYMFWYDDPDIPGGMAPRVIGDRVINVGDLNDALDFIYTPVQTPGIATVAFGRKRRIDLDVTAYPVTSQDILIPNGCSITEMADSLIKTYGGYICRNKYQFKIVPDRITRSTQEMISYGSNLKSFTAIDVDSGIAHGILAVGTPRYDSEPTGLKAYGDTDAFMARRVKFDQKNILSEDYNTQYTYIAALGDDLNDKANKYLVKNANMKVNYEIKALTSGVTDLWDNVIVKDPRYDMDIDATVISFQYDLLLKEFKDITFGNYSSSMLGYNSRINSQINDVRREIPLKSYPIGTVITWTNSLIASPNAANSGFEGYWTSLGNNTWQRVI